eukprot:Hpha_TRINITY_DN16312_c1_g2::TRINITY_DN16312_c1_g2_i1::g.59590::m.59590
MDDLVQDGGLVVMRRLGICSLLACYCWGILLLPFLSWVTDTGINGRRDAAPPVLAGIFRFGVWGSGDAAIPTVPASTRLAARLIETSDSSSAALYRSMVQFQFPSTPVSVAPQQAEEGPRETPAHTESAMAIRSWINLTARSFFHFNSTTGEAQVTIVRPRFLTGVGHHPSVGVVEHYVAAIGDLVGKAAEPCAEGEAAQQTDPTIVNGVWYRTSADSLPGPVVLTSTSHDRGCIGLVYEHVRLEHKAHVLRLYWLADMPDSILSAPSGGESPSWLPARRCEALSMAGSCFEIVMRGGLSVHLVEFVEHGRCVLYGRADDTYEWRTMCFSVDSKGGLHYQPGKVGPTADRTHYDYKTIAATQTGIPDSPYCGSTGCEVGLTAEIHGGSVAFKIHWATNVSDQDQTFFGEASLSVHRNADGKAWNLTRFIDFQAFRDTGEGTVEGELIMAGSGCTLEQHQEIVKAHQEGRRVVALVDRGSCTFFVKAHHAASSGALAVLVVNSEGGLPFSGVQEGAASHPVLLVDRERGQEMKAWVKEGGASVRIEVRRMEPEANRWAVDAGVRSSADLPIESETPRHPWISEELIQFRAVDIAKRQKRRQVGAVSSDGHLMIFTHLSGNIVLVDLSALPDNISEILLPPSRVLQVEPTESVWEETAAGLGARVEFLQRAHIAENAEAFCVVSTSGVLVYLGGARVQPDQPTDVVQEVQQRPPVEEEMPELFGLLVELLKEVGQVFLGIEDEDKGAQAGPEGWYLHAKLPHGEHADDISGSAVVFDAVLTRAGPANALVLVVLYDAGQIAVYRLDPACGERDRDGETVMFTEPLPVFFGNSVPLAIVFVWTIVVVTIERFIGIGARGRPGLRRRWTGVAVDVRIGTPPPRNSPRDEARASPQPLARDEGEEDGEHEPLIMREEGEEERELAELARPPSRGGGGEGSPPPSSPPPSPPVAAVVDS